MLSPSLSRITNRMRSSITELSFHGIPLPPPSRGKSVTHVSGTFCYLCVEPHIKHFQPVGPRENATRRQSVGTFVGMLFHNGALFLLPLAFSAPGLAFGNPV